MTLWGVIMLIAGCALPVGDDYRSPISGSVEAASIIAEYNLRIYVPIPVAGETPVKAITRADMDIAVIWKDDQGLDITESLSAFVVNAVYQADITLTAKNGYTFDGGINFKYIPGDIVEVQPGDNSNPDIRSLSTVTYKPAQPPQPIDEDLDLTPYLPPPVTRATPVTSFAAPQYTGTVAWEETVTSLPLAGPFLPGTAYKAVVSLIAASGYVFTGIPITGSESFTHSASSAAPVFTIDPVKPAKGTVVIEFNETELIPVSDYNLRNYVPVPVEGQRPVTAVDRAELGAVVTWYDASSVAIPNPDAYTFVLGAVYQADITLTAKTGYTFNPAASFKYVPAAAVTTQPNDDFSSSSRTLTRGIYKSTPAPTMVTLLDLTGLLPRPVSGGTPTATISTAQYTGKVTWSPVESGGLFLPKKIYQAVIELTAISGYTFSGIGSFIHTGGVGVGFTLDADPVRGTAIINFPETNSLGVADYNLASYIPLPAAGQPLISSADFPRLSVSVVWKKNNALTSDAVFQSDDEYQADITLTAAAGYAFTSAFSYSSGQVYAQSNSPNLSGNGKYAQTASVTYKAVPRNILSFGPANTTPNSAMKLLYDKRTDSTITAAAPLEIQLPAGWEAVPAGAVNLVQGTSGPGAIILDGGGRTLQLSGNGTILAVGDGVTLTLRNITLRGHAANNTALVRVDTGGKLYLEDGAVVRDNVSSGTHSLRNGGGGVQIRGSSFVNSPEAVLDGGTITGNTAYNSGGAVYIYLGTFTMKRGTISGNKVSDSNALGGGVGGDLGGEFYLEGGTISGNTAKLGGGVYAFDGCFITMNGGTISGNTATAGGGVYSDASAINGSLFTMNDGTISDNYSTGTGGGVSARKFVMTGGIIRDNYADNTGYLPGGGGVWGGQFTMSGGIIRNNTTLGQGGGVQAHRTINMSGGVIMNNSAAEGGGVYSSGVSTTEGFTMTGGTIQGNMATISGGGIQATNLIIEGGNIWNNTAPLGGGLYGFPQNANYMEFTLKGGSIMGNTASLGSGIYINNTYYLVFAEDGWVHKDNPVYFVAGTFEQIRITGTLSKNPAANITTSGPISSGHQLLYDDYAVDNNYQKFLVEGQPGKIGSDGKYNP
jgi:hypothetical protein